MAVETFHYKVFEVKEQSPYIQFAVHLKAILKILLFLFSFSFSGNTKAQVADEDFEEISVFLAIQGVGGYEINAIYKNDKIYLPIAEMFQCLKINQTTTDFNDTIKGFFLDENNKYIISQPSKSIFINGKLIQLKDDELFNSETTSLALRLDQYGKIFGLDCKFNFSSLSVELKTNLELPVIKELRLEQMRKNISRLRGEIKVDTTYERKYHLFKGGMADWAIYSTQISGGTTETRALLGLGAEFLGGETNIEINYSTRNKFEKRQQQYQWRWANNNTKIVKQITVGKISSKSVASIYSPLIGTVITNTPTTFRRSFGSYTMTDFTEPGWTVELYINNVVVDYTTADAKGFFKFDIPLVYGSSNVMVKFYGPWGEERQKEQTINVPYTFLPKGEMQYTVAGAMVQDTSHSVFTRGETNFGITRHLTLGGGFEYLSSIISTPSIPFVTGSAQILNNVLFNGEYAYGVRTKALLSYSLPSNFVLDIDYTKYTKEQKAITFNYLEERKVRFSIPVSIRKFKAYTRFSYIQNILKETNYTTAEATLSTYIKGVSANFTGNANWLKDKEPYIFGNLALGFRFFHTLSLRPQVQYDFSNKDLIFTKVELENNFSPKSNLSLVWENNVRNNINTIELTFRYDLSFMQTSVNTRVSKDYISTGQSAIGSFAFGSGNGRVIADIRNQVGRAGITVIPFLDVNNNNRKDDDEPVTTGMDIRINGGRIVSSSKDSIIRILDLEPFASYMIELSDNQFDNIAWQIKHKTISILMDPNQFKLLEIPIKIMGEINGMVFMRTGARLKTQGRIQINIFDESGNFVAKTQSESDGYYTFLGLAPGKYHAEPDSMQLARLKSVSIPNRFDFEIKATTYGDIIDNIEFVLTKKATNKPVELIPEQKNEEIPTVAAKEAVVAIPHASNTNKETAEHKFFIQAGAFKKQKNADRLMKELSELTSQKWFIDNEDGWYKVRIGYFDSKETATEIKGTLNATDIAYYITELASNKVPEPSQTAQEITQSKTVVAKEVQKQTATNENNGTFEKASMDCEDSLHPQNGYFVQAGAFAIKSNAEKLVIKLRASTGQNWFIACGKGLYKVRLGYFSSKQEAWNLSKTMNETGIRFYVNKPKGVVINDQFAKVDQIPQQQTLPKQVTPVVKEPQNQAVPVVTPEPEKPKKIVPKQEEANEGKPAEGNPAAKKVVAETKKGTEKTKKVSKDGIVEVPPIDDINKVAVEQKYYIQAGAFDSKDHAERLARYLLSFTLKRWFIIYEDGLYKVRLGYFATKEAAKLLEGTLNTTEVPYYVDGTPVNPMPVQNNNGANNKRQKQKVNLKPNSEDKKTDAKSIIVTNPDKTKSTKEDKQTEKPVVKETEKPRQNKRNPVVITPPNDNTSPHKFFIQADAFTTKVSAEKLVADLTERTRKEWFIVYEEDLFKVRLGYFESRDEAKYVEGTLNTPETSYYIDEISAE